MKVNIENAAKNTLDGIKAIGDVIDDVHKDQLHPVDGFYAIAKLFMDHQPQFSAFVINEFFHENTKQDKPNEGEGDD